MLKKLRLVILTLCSTVFSLRGCKLANNLSGTLIVSNASQAGIGISNSLDIGDRSLANRINRPVDVFRCIVAS